MLGLPGDSQLWGAPDAHSQHLRVNMGTFSGTLRIRLCPGPSHPLGKESPALSQASRRSGQAQPVRVPEEASPPGSRAVHTQGESLPAHRAADYRQHQDPASAAALLAGRGVAPAPTMLQTCRPPAVVGAPARQAGDAAGPAPPFLWPHHSRASPGRRPPTLSFDVEVRSLTMPRLQITQSHLFKEQVVPWTQTLHPCIPDADSQSALPAPGQLHGLVTFSCHLNLMGFYLRGLAHLQAPKGCAG